MTKILLHDEQLSLIKNHNKVASYLSKEFSSRLFLKLSPEGILLLIRGTSGAYRLEVPVETHLVDSQYISVDFGKWMSALDKFSYSDTLELSLDKSFLSLGTGNSFDTINLGISKYDASSSEASIVDQYVADELGKIQEGGEKLELTDSLMQDLSLAASLFLSQSDTNAIGLGKEDTIYSDRLTVLKIKHADPIDPSLFSNEANLDTGYITLHKYLVGLFGLISPLNPTVYVNDLYDVFGWSDGSSSLIITSEPCEIQLPTEEEFQGIIPPETASSFSAPLSSFRKGISFFQGFYDGNVWQPIEFLVKKDSGVDLHFSGSSAELLKPLADVSTPNSDAAFVLSAEILEKIVYKAISRFGEDALLTLRYDDKAPGVYGNIAGVYEASFANLQLG